MEWGKSIFSLVAQLILSLSTVRAVDSDLGQKCKNANEAKHRTDCVCNSQALWEYFSPALAISPSMKEQASSVISKRMDAFSCSNFIPLPPYIDIEMTDSIPSPYYGLRRYRHRKRLRAKRDLWNYGHHRSKRQISLGFPTDSKWEEIIPHLPKHGRHYYAPVGSPVTLRCSLGHNEEGQAGVQDLVDDSDRKFTWTHANGMEITAPNVVTDRTNGDLTFWTVRLADTGIYNCTISDTEGELEDGRTYQSQLDVVAGPTFWLRFGMTYKTPRCRHKELLEIQRNIPILVHKYVCHFCTVRNVSMTCIAFGDEGRSGGEKIVQLTMAMSTIGFEEILPSWKHNYVHCNLECQKGLHAKVLKVTAESLVKLFSLQIHVRSIDETSIYSAIPESWDEDLADGCPPGFSLRYSLCFPCAPGRFSPSGPADCFPCVKGFFQPNPGSSACFHCPKGHTTMKRGSLSQMDCILESASFWVQFFNENMILLVWIGLVLLLLVFLIILIICCWPNSAIGRCLRCVSCCGEEGCCGGGENVEKEIMDDERERLLVNEDSSTTELDSIEDDMSENEMITTPKRKQTRIFQNDSRNYRDDFRSSEENEGENAEENVTLSIERESTKSKSKSPFSSIKRLDLSKFRIKRPILPRPRHKGRCETTIKNLEQQEYEEELDEQSANPEDEEENVPQPPPPLPQNVNETSESSDTKTFFSRNPHLKLGNVLRKSKSLMTKLAEQRKKLRHWSRHQSKSPSAVASLPASKNKMKNSKMVTISESRNTFHPPCRQCSTQEFQKERESRERRKNKLHTGESNSTRMGRSVERVKNKVEKFQKRLMSKKR